MTQPAATQSTELSAPVWVASAKVVNVDPFHVLNFVMFSSSTSHTHCTTQRVDDAQATPVMSMVLVAGSSSSAGRKLRAVHAEPFQVWTIGIPSCVTCSGPAVPTAMQKLLDGQSTAARPWRGATAGLVTGAGTVAVQLPLS